MRVYLNFLACMHIMEWKTSPKMNHGDSTIMLPRSFTFNRAELMGRWMELNTVLLHYVCMHTKQIVPEYEFSKYERYPNAWQDSLPFLFTTSS